VLSFIKYAKDKQKLQELLVTDSSFQNIGKDAIDVINTCTGAKLKQEERRVVNVCQAIQEIAEEAAEKAREEVRAQMRAEMEKAEAKATAEAKKEKNSMMLKSIKALMEKAGLTLEQSMSALDLSESDRKNLIPLI
jgi:predicted transposase YdaD